MLMAGLAVTPPCPMLSMPWVLHDPHEAVTSLLFWSEGSRWVKKPASALPVPLVQH